MSAMPIMRTYACPDCHHEITVMQAPEDGPPDCPKCAAGTAWQPKPFAIRSNLGRLGDHVYRELERTAGITDMADNLREGDTAEKAPPENQAHQTRWASVAEIGDAAIAAGRADPNRQALKKMMFNS